MSGGMVDMNYDFIIYVYASPSGRSRSQRH